MKLFEEYNQRHGLAVPLILPTTGCLIHSDDDYPHWSLLDIVQESKKGNPDFYVVHFYKPVHDNTFYHPFADKEKPIKLEWDEFEDYFIDWFQNRSYLEHRVVLDRDDVFLASWDMFLFYNDSWLATHGNHELIYQSLNTELTRSIRIASVLECLRGIRMSNQHVYSAWEREFEPIPDRYLKWADYAADIRRIRTI